MDMQALAQLKANWDKTSEHVTEVEAWLHSLLSPWPGIGGGLIMRDPNTPDRFFCAAADPALRQLLLPLGLASPCQHEEMIALLVKLKQPFAIPDLTEFEDTTGYYAPYASYLNVGSMLFLPIRSQQKRLGLLWLYSPEAGRLTAQAPEVQQISEMARVYLHLRDRLYWEQRHTLHLESLVLASTDLLLDVDLEQVMLALLERLRQAVGFDSAAILLVEDDRLRAWTGIDLPHPERVFGQYFPAHDPLMVRMRQERRPIVLVDAEQSPDFRDWGDVAHVRGWMGIPLLNGADLIGYITLDSKQPGFFTEVHIELAQLFAQQATVTIINALTVRHHYEAARRQHAVSQTLHLLNTTTQVRQILPALTRSLHSLFRWDGLDLAIFDGEDHLIDHHCRPDDPGEVVVRRMSVSRLEQERMGQAVWQGQLERGQIVAQPLADGGIGLERARRREGFGWNLLIPLTTPERSLGALQFLWWPDTPRPLLHNELLEQISNAIALTVERNLPIAETERHVEEMRIIQDLTTALRSLESSQAVMRTGLEHVVEILRGSRGRIVLPTPQDGGTLEIACEVAPPDMVTRIREPLTVDNSVTGYVYLSGQPYLMDNAIGHALAHVPSQESWAARGVTHLPALFAPLQMGEQTIGAVTVVSAEPEVEYTQRDLGLLCTLSNIIGTAMHRAWVLEDLERRVVERTQDLAQANRQLQELEQLKSAFVANVSHELRTPLTNLRFYLNLLQRGRPEKHAQYLAVMEEEAQHLQSLIESILDLSTLDQQRASVNDAQQIVNLGEAVAKAMHTLRTPAEKKRIRVELIARDLPLLIQGDPLQITQMALNLLVNAVNYTPQGGQVTAALWAEEESQQAKLQIRDTGIGIGPEEREKIFERFYRGQQVMETGVPGTGLGLSIVKEILALHRGQITVEGQPGQGSCFTVSLPLVPADSVIDTTS